MAGRKRIPAAVQSQYRDLHRSNEEIEQRLEQESAIQVKKTAVKVPSYVKDPEKKKRFRKYAKMLKEVSDQLCTALDADALAAYIDAQMNYEFDQQLIDEYQRQKMAALDDEDGGQFSSVELERLERIRNAAQAKADKLRSDLLLEPASRARAAIAKQEKPKENKFAKFEVDDD